MAEVALTDDDLVALLRRVTDEPGWLQPLLDHPESRAVLLALVHLFARVGATVRHNADALTISSSSGGQPGTTGVSISRAASGTSGTIPQGYPFVDERGVVLRTQVAVPVSSGQTSVFLPLVTDRQSEVVNSEDSPALAFAPDAGIVMDAAASTVLIAPPGSPGIVSTTFQALGTADPISGAAANYLAVHGEERGLLQQPIEDEASFRQRLRNIPDAVTPYAIADIVQGVVQQLGLPTFLIREPFNDGADAALKDPRWLSFFSPPVVDADVTTLATDFLDDPLGNHILVDRRSYTCYFDLVAQEYLRDPNLAVLYLDNGFADDTSFGYMDAYAGAPPQAVHALLALVDQVRQKIALGVQFDCFAKDPDVLTFAGQTISATKALVFTATPPAGKAWLVVRGESGHDFADPDFPPVREAKHDVVYTLADASTLAAGDYGGTDTRRLPVPLQFVTQIRGYVTADEDGDLPVHLVGSFWVHQIAI